MGGGQNPPSVIPARASSEVIGQNPSGGLNIHTAQTFWGSSVKGFRKVESSTTGFHVCAINANTKATPRRPMLVEDSN